MNRTQDESDYIMIRRSLEELVSHADKLIDSFQGSIEEKVYFDFLKRMKNARVALQQSVTIEEIEDK